MPRLYLTPTQFTSYPQAITFAGQVAQLTAISGAMDQLLARASRRVDNYARKRIVQPGATTVGSGGISQGGTSLPVASTLGFDNGQEQAVILGSGGTQEIVPLVPGGVQVTSWSSPYPGTLTLASGVFYSHNTGEAVQGCYQEVSTVGSSGSSDVYSESLLALNQAAQLAQAHAPSFDTSGLTRIIFLKCYPIVPPLLKMEHMLPIDSQYSTLDASQVGIQTAAGYLRLPIGSFVLPEGLFRTTYRAGFAYPPDDIQEATALYAADALQSMASQGAYEIQMSKRRVKYAADQTVKSRYQQEAEGIIDDGNYRRRT
ncbi:hypothetical protein KSF_095940 [Reticulibacter mediterranei]|uniref:Uncharacterized protein n=1 Tax=Reticulibacter mediterranei TaxID=2778369 RepID=A0A8J3J2F9_9CHLR|nr:hypothetical protein [Reticulibacter mediterranei]GHO99546.1 hypothetical protein KSF_095940 [Reticulibacter mediterranei]